MIDNDIEIGNIIQINIINIIIKKQTPFVYVQR